MLEFEVGGGEPYYRKFLSRPTWPGELSGVTIGIGYDLGYNSADQIREDWGKLLPADALALLLPAAGVTVEAARVLAGTLHNRVEIPWASAWAVFQRSTVPRFIALTRATFPGLDALPADAKAALVSLVFNRGSAMAGDRRKEMATIRDCVRNGTPAALKLIPGLIRDMRRLWQDNRGLMRRRDAEAALFAKAIA